MAVNIQAAKEPLFLKKKVVNNKVVRNSVSLRILGSRLNTSKNLKADQKALGELVSTHNYTRRSRAFGGKAKEASAAEEKI